MKKAMGVVVAALALLGAGYVIWKFQPDEDRSTQASAKGGAATELQVGEHEALRPPELMGDASRSSSASHPAPAVGSAPANPKEAAIRAIFETTNPFQQDMALQKLVARADSNTVAALVKALAMETDVDRLGLICRALNGIGTEESFLIFRDFLDKPENARYREHVADTLIALENAELSGRVLDWMLDTQDDEIARACQEAVGRLATGEVIERIIAEHARRNPGDPVLGMMRAALESSECPEAIDALRAALENPSVELQASAARALANIGTRPAIDALIAALEKSGRNPSSDFLGEAVASLHASHLQAYLQEIFDQTASPDVKYALGRALAETIEPPEEAEHEMDEEFPDEELSIMEGDVLDEEGGFSLGFGGMEFDGEAGENEEDEFPIEPDPLTPSDDPHPPGVD